MHTRNITETIFVTAQFTKKGPKPISFIWKNDIYHVTDINFIHKSTEGTDLLTHFSVTCGYASYFLTFNSTTLSWKLEEIYSE